MKNNEIEKSAYYQLEEMTGAIFLKGIDETTFKVLLGFLGIPLNTVEGLEKINTIPADTTIDSAPEMPSEYAEEVGLADNDFASVIKPAAAIDKDDKDIKDTSDTNATDMANKETAEEAFEESETMNAVDATKITASEKTAGPEPEMSESTTTPEVLTDVPTMPEDSNELAVTNVINASEAESEPKSGVTEEAEVTNVQVVETTETCAGKKYFFMPKKISEKAIRNLAKSISEMKAFCKKEGINLVEDGREFYVKSKEEKENLEKTYTFLKEK